MVLERFSSVLELHIRFYILIDTKYIKMFRNDFPTTINYVHRKDVEWDEYDTHTRCYSFDRTIYKNFTIKFLYCLHRQRLSGKITLSIDISG